MSFECWINKCVCVCVCAQCYNKWLFPWCIVGTVVVQADSPAVIRCFCWVNDESCSVWFFCIVGLLCKMNECPVLTSRGRCIIKYLRICMAHFLSKYSNTAVVLLYENQAACAASLFFLYHSWETSSFLCAFSCLLLLPTEHSSDI